MFSKTVILYFLFYFCELQSKLQNNIGNPHVPPSLIVAKIMEQFQLSEKKAGKFMDSLSSNRPLSAPPTSGQNVFDMPDISET